MRTSRRRGCRAGALGGRGGYGGDGIAGRGPVTSPDPDPIRGSGWALGECVRYALFGGCAEAHPSLAGVGVLGCVGRVRESDHSWGGGVRPGPACAGMTGALASRALSSRRGACGDSDVRKGLTFNTVAPGNGLGDRVGVGIAIGFAGAVSRAIAV